MDIILSMSLHATHVNEIGLQFETSHDLPLLNTGVIIAFDHTFGISCTEKELNIADNGSAKHAPRRLIAGEVVHLVLRLS